MKDPNSIEQFIATRTERELTETERRRLNQLLRKSPEAMDTWLDHCEMETWLAAGGSSFADDRTLLSPALYPVESGTP